MSAILLTVAPALALALLLLARRFPGEQRLVAIAARRRPRRRQPAPLRPGAPPTPWAVAPHGAALLARALAKRPPPAALLI